MTKPAQPRKLDWLGRPIQPKTHSKLKAHQKPPMPRARKASRTRKNKER